MSAFAEPLVLLRGAVDRAHARGKQLFPNAPPDAYDGERDEFRAALDRVERLATDYEAALETIANGAWPKDVQASVSVSNLARAVLSAREEGADTR